jgi:hypothetical protein
MGVTFLDAEQNGNFTSAAAPELATTQFAKQNI